MTLASFAFYMFATVTVASALMVISARNPVHSVLFLILTFFNSAGIFLLLGAEFLALLLVIVYVGAVAVLFLFVVMMLDIDFVELNEGFLQYLPVGTLVGLVLLTELIMVLGGSTMEPDIIAGGPKATTDEMTNAEALGLVLYTDYVFFFQTAGAILLVAMVGAIVLTLRKRDNPKRQSVAAQNARRRDESVEVVKVKPGQGL
ncbi:MAG: NADH:ubiquinone oxidoreductase subunit J [Rhizobiales bacterium]|nr:NADH:ubiquinone oxidoreductase subunit J [Hyphomicrobiales bacterium]